jgi:hypothetical protein
MKRHLIAVEIVCGVWPKSERTRTALTHCRKLKRGAGKMSLDEKHRAYPAKGDVLAVYVPLTAGAAMIIAILG